MVDSFTEISPYNNGSVLAVEGTVRDIMNNSPAIVRYSYSNECEVCPDDQMFSLYIFINRVDFVLGCVCISLFHML